MRDEIETYRRCDIRPFGVNPATAERHADYAARLGLPFPLLSDTDSGSAGATERSGPTARRLRARSAWWTGTGLVLYSQAGAPGADLSLEGLNCR